MPIYWIIAFFLNQTPSFASSDVETKKTYIEDIFIWKMSDELKLSAQEEKSFTEIHKNLNKQKAELNKKIQEITVNQGQSVSFLTKSQLETNLKKLRKLITDYNQLSLNEFDSMKKLLGSIRFSAYLQIKSELNNKVKSMLTGEKPVEKDKKETSAVKLPPPQVIIEKNE
jgi:hypothetical protein